MAHIVTPWMAAVAGTSTIWPATARTYDLTVSVERDDHGDGGGIDIHGCPSLTRNAGRHVLDDPKHVPETHRGGAAMFGRRVTSLMCGFATLFAIGLGSVPSQAATVSSPQGRLSSTPATQSVSRSAVAAADCTFFALRLNRYVSGGVAYVEGNATARCSYRPRSCTYHIVLQTWDVYFHTWVQVEDRWYTSCPSPVGATKTMYTPEYDCSAPYFTARFRTVLTATTVGNSGTWNNQVISYDRAINC
jgi:hypothetical protein